MMCRQGARGGRGGMARWGAVSILALAVGMDLCRAAPTTSTAPATQVAEPPTQPAKVVLPSEVELTEEAVQQRIKAAQQAEGLDASAREKLLALYNQALAEVHRLQELTAKAADLDKLVQEAPGQIQQFQQAASQPATSAEAVAPPEMTLEQMETQLKQLGLQLADLRKQAADVAEQAKALADSREKLPALIAAAKDQLTQLRAKPPAPPGQGPPSRDKEAELLVEAARRRALEAAVGAYEKELATHEMVADLLRARQEFYARRAAQMEAAVKAWQEAAARRREQEDKRRVAEARQAERQAAGKHRLVQEATRQNTRLAEQSTGPGGLSERLKQVRQSLDDVKANLEKLDKSFEKARTMEGQVGLTNIIGILLRQQRDALSDPRQLRRRSAARQDEILQARMEVFRLNEMLAELADPDVEARKMVDQADPPVPPAQREDVLAWLGEALSARKTLLVQIPATYQQYFYTLVDLDTAEKRLAAKAEEFGEYIDERILWIRTARPVGAGELPKLWEAMKWLTAPKGWIEAGRSLAADLRASPALWAAAAAVLGALLAARKKLRAVLLRIDEQVSPREPDALARTLGALLLTVCLTIGWPLLLWFVGWRLASEELASPMGFALSRGLILAAMAWLPVELLRQICRPRGLAEMHFRWHAASLRRIGRHLSILTAAGLPLLVVLGMTEAQDVDAHRESLGRLALIALLILLGGSLIALLRPRGQVVQDAIGRRKDGWVYRLRHLWYPLVALCPIGLAAAAVFGYYDAAVQLANRLIVQFWVVLALLVLHAMLLRWILLARVRLTLRAVQARKAESEPGGAAEAPPTEGPAKAAIDVPVVSAQTREFIRYAVVVLFILATWSVWVRVLPALNILRRVELWKVMVDGTLTAVTLADAGLALLVVCLTVVAGKNLPGLLEMTFLQRMQVDAGVRYAVGAVVRYVIAVVGVVVAFHLIGLNWSHVQWLVAAITVGLGFGLQEVFANFVCGLIILLERPIRVGDVVTVGGIHGTVTRIRIRATTIVDWDRKELIVPNKQFITERVVNWTLSDSVVRMVIPVGVAYGSDTALAARLLMEIAQSHPHVAKDPPPHVAFMRFGDSALELELRVFTDTMQHRLAVQTDLHMSIDREFRQAGIEIAFPQRDVHIRSLPPGLTVAMADPKTPADARTPDASGKAD